VTNAERLDAAFRRALGLDDGIEPAEAAYGQTEGWDSVGHMELVVGIEAAFGIAIDGDDMLEMSDYAAVRRILRDRHAIDLGDR
jgi:acyl carrier protein